MACIWVAMCSAKTTSCRMERMDTRKTAATFCYNISRVLLSEI